MRERLLFLLGATLLATACNTPDSGAPPAASSAPASAASLAAAAAAEAEDVLLAEKGRLAATLAQVPGREAEALRAGLAAVQPRLASPERISLAATAGLAAAVAANRTLAILAGDSAIFADRGAIVAVAFSSDGSRIFTASSDATARLWDSATARSLATLTSPGLSLNAAALSPDGTRVLIAGSNCAGYLVDAANDDAFFTLEHPRYKPTAMDAGSEDALIAGAFSPDGTRAATATAGGDVRLWNSATGALIAALVEHRGQVPVLAFSPDSSRLVSGGEDRSAHLWNARTGASIAALTGHTRLVRAAAFSPDSKRLATASWDDTARLWDAVTGTLTGTCEGHGSPLLAVTFSPDGREILTGSADGAARLFDERGGAATRVLRGHKDFVAGVAYSPDGRRILTASHDGTARLWSADGESIAVLAGHRGAVRAVAFSPDGSRAVTGAGDGTARLWDVRAVRPLLDIAAHTSPSGGTMFALAGPYLLEGYLGPIRLVRTDDGKDAATFQTDLMYPMALSADGTRALLHVREESELWDLQTGKALTVLAPFPNVAIFSADGSRLAVSSSRGGTTELYNGRHGTPIATIRGNSEVLAFSRDGARLVVAGGASAQLLDSGEGRVLANLPHKERVSSVAIAPDGSLTATASDDGAVHLWSARGDVIAELVTHGRVAAVAIAIAPDGKRVAAVTGDGVVALWEAGGKLISERRTTGELEAVAFSPDGRTFASGGQRGAELWDAGTGERIAAFPGYGRPVIAVAYTPDGKRLIAVDNGGHARVYPATAEGFAAQASELLRLQPESASVGLAPQPAPFKELYGEGAPCHTNATNLCENDSQRTCRGERCLNPCGSGRALQGGTECVTAECMADADCQRGYRCDRETSVCKRHQVK